MKMRRRVALLVGIAMLLSVIPVGTLSVSAAEGGDWITYRSAGDYIEPEVGEIPDYKPAPGYEYTEEGFHTIPADYTNMVPYMTVQTKETFNLREGIYLEMRVDNYSYGGADGAADHWISFHIWDSPNILPGNTTDYGQGWLSLVRNSGEGSTGSVQSFTSHSEGHGVFLHHGDISIAPHLDVNGKEIYTFEVINNGSNYEVFVCGVPVSGAEAITAHLDEVNPDGDFYIGVTMYSGEVNGTCELTLLKFGHNAQDATVPTGTDYKEPEKNPTLYANVMDPATIPENTPALLLNAGREACEGDLGLHNMTLYPKEHNALGLSMLEANTSLLWEIHRYLSYDAQDFPVVAFFVEDPNMLFEWGSLEYATGHRLETEGSASVAFSVYDAENLHYGGNGEYTLLILPMEQILGSDHYANNWVGRIHALRLNFEGLSMESDPALNEMTLHWVGVFRSVEEAYAYNEDYISNFTCMLPPDAETSDASDTPDTEEPEKGENETEKLPQVNVEETTRPMPDGQESQDLAQNMTNAGYTVVNCSANSEVTLVTLLLSAVAAAVVLSKKKT